MPEWIQSIGCVALSIQDAVRIFAFVAIIAFGLMVMFMELKGWIQDLMKVLFGISIALFAASFLNGVFPNRGFGNIGGPQCGGFTSIDTTPLVARAPAFAVVAVG